MSLTWEALEGALRSEDAKGVVALLRGASEAERKACAKPLLDLRTREPHVRRFQAFALAGLGCAGGPQQITRTFLWLGVDDVVDEAVEILADRGPPWLPGFATTLVTASDLRSAGWRLARGLVRAGLSQRPEDPRYTEHMVDSFWPRRGGPSLSKMLLQDPGLLDHEIWRLFEVEGISSQMQGTELWSSALVGLARDGHIDRGRLLDATLGALLRDFKASQVGWM